MRKLKDLDPLIHILFVVAIAILISALVILQRQVNAINKRLSQQGVEVSSGGTRILFEDCGKECKSEIKKAVSDAIATVVVRPKSQQTSYISLDGTVSATSTSWVDAPGIEVAFDLTQDYSKDAPVSWEASLKVAHGNGQAYARLFDVTNGIAVAGSEISTTNNSSYLRVNSGKLGLWAGRNVYRVQLKSLNSFEITYTGGKIRITH
ncbi:MAG: hypothetical protein AAB875_07235 [Patescibacteria group bacterium]